jgi:hypothetical protein
MLAHDAHVPDMWASSAWLATGISARFGDMLQDIDENGDGVVVSWQ